MLNHEDEQGLDPGIRLLVRLLNDHGFETCDSGDGKSKLAIPEDERDRSFQNVPNVVIRAKQESMIAEAYRLWTFLVAHGLDPMESKYDEYLEQDHAAWQIEAVYFPPTMCMITLTGVDDAKMGLS